MRIKVNTLGESHTILDAEILGDTTLSKVFNGIEILTEDNHKFGIAQRDTGIEVKCPDGAMIEIKIDEEGDTFVAAHGVKDE